MSARGLNVCAACGGPLFAGTWRVVGERPHEHAVHDECWTLLFNAELTAQRARLAAEDAVRRQPRLRAVDRRMSRNQPRRRRRP